MPYIFFKNSSTCKKVMKSLNLSPKKLFLFQYWMAIKLLCNHEACHIITFKMTVYFIFRFINCSSLRKKVLILFVSNSSNSVNTYTEYFHFLGLPYYYIWAKNKKKNIWLYESTFQIFDQNRTHVLPKNIVKLKKHDILIHHSVISVIIN